MADEKPQPRKRLSLAVAVVVVTVLLLQLVSFRVRETERAVVKTFGNVTRVIQDAPGLYWKWPAPIQEVVRLDARLRVLEGPLEEATTADKKSVLLACFVAWKPGDAATFLQGVGTVEAAEKQLESLLRDAVSASIGQFPFGALVSADPARLRWDDLEKAISDRLGKTALEQYGVSVAFVGVRRLALPKDTTESVFARMRAERDVKAKQSLAEGQALAQEIKDQADRERAEALEQARVEAKKVMAEADRDSKEAYLKLEQDPDLAIFLRKVEALKRGLSGRTTVVFDMNAWPFDLLLPKTPPAPVGSGAK